MIRVAIVEDIPTLREGFVSLINGTEGYCCVGSFGDCETMLQDIEGIAPDVLLMDIRLPGMSGIEGVRKVRKILPNINILILTVYEESDIIFEALCAGANGYLVKKTPRTRLLEAIRETHEGGSAMSAQVARKVVDFFQQSTFINVRPGRPVGDASFNLTPREYEILSGLVQGRSYQAIGDNLFISTNTVRFHIRNIYRKLHVHSQSEAVAKALRNGLV